MSEKKAIPIVMAANEKYAPYLGITIHSIAGHISKEYEYRIFVLETKISAYHKLKIKQLEKENMSISFIDVSSMIAEFDIPIVNHLSPETAYRLLTDRIFPEYEKVLYIDCDTIVLRDLAELYEENIEGYILGASLGRIEEGLEEYLKKELKFPMKDYFNAGVLIINIPLFRDENIGIKALKMLEEKTYLSMDQDVLNILCRGNVKYIDGHWNVEWQHLTGIGGAVVVDEAREGTLDYINDPYIVHYTSHYKPWAHPEIQLSEYFWEEARKTSFYEEVLFQNLEREDLFSHYLFPWKTVELHSRIILYGYGNVGKVLYEQVRKTNYCNIVAICDKRADDINNVSTKVLNPQMLKEFELEYDIILLALEKEKVADGVKKELIELGIEDSVIKWAEYRR